MSRFFVVSLIVVPGSSVVDGRQRDQARRGSDVYAHALTLSGSLNLKVVARVVHLVQVP